MLNSATCIWHIPWGKKESEHSVDGKNIDNPLITVHIDIYMNISVLDWPPLAREEVEGGGGYKEYCTEY